jgi:hypothetical protein
MPVSKKRKKDGKPVKRQGHAAEEGTEAAHEEAHLAPQQMKAGKPKNPFIAHQPQVRSSQRGR